MGTEARGREWEIGRLKLKKNAAGGTTNYDLRTEISSSQTLVL